jgi:hypothetical protein
MTRDGQMNTIKVNTLEECPMPWTDMGKYIAAYLELESPSGKKNKEWLEKYDMEHQAQATIWKVIRDQYARLLREQNYSQGLSVMMLQVFSHIENSAY